MQLIVLDGTDSFHRSNMTPIGRKDWHQTRIHIEMTSVGWYQCRTCSMKHEVRVRDSKYRRYTMYRVRDTYINLDVVRSRLDIMTVQAPQPPSAQPSFVPVNRNVSRRKEINV